MRYVSPLRYPGGKAGMADFLASVIELNALDHCAYYEPYAGGAGAALNLLNREAVSELYLNDADRRIYAFWRSAIFASDRFVDRIRQVPLTIAEWHRQHDICARPASHSQFEVGFAAFYMNRCNRSGVLTGSGPIGGYRQMGRWGITARFCRDALSERIISLARRKDHIHLSCKDAVAFLKTNLPRGLARSRLLVFLDPPYVHNGRRLYLNAYDPRDHAYLARYLQNQRSLPWIMSYDDHPLIRALYSDLRLTNMPIRYSLQAKRPASELVISPHYLTTPKRIHTSGAQPY